MNKHLKLVVNKTSAEDEAARIIDLIVALRERSIECDLEKLKSLKNHFRDIAISANWAEFVINNMVALTCALERKPT